MAFLTLGSGDYEFLKEGRGRLEGRTEGERDGEGGKLLRAHCVLRTRRCGKEGGTDEPHPGNPAEL